MNHLNWSKHKANLIPKLTRAIGLLSKIRHYVTKELLRTLYFSLFNSHLIYGCQVWNQNSNSLKKTNTVAR